MLLRRYGPWWADSPQRIERPIRIGSPAPGDLGSLELGVRRVYISPTGVRLLAPREFAKSGKSGGGQARKKVLDEPLTRGQARFGELTEDLGRGGNQFGAARGLHGARERLLF